jgi:hypothetical protein
MAASFAGRLLLGTRPGGKLMLRQSFKAPRPTFAFAMDRSKRDVRFSAVQYFSLGDLSFVFKALPKNSRF